MSAPAPHRGAAAERAWAQALTGLFDDAALFPPGDAPMADAVPRHFEHRDARYGAMVGSFVCTDRRLPELAGHLTGPGPVLELSLVAAGGCDSLAAAVAEARAHPRIRLTAVELPAPQATAPELWALLERTAAALPDGVVRYAEVPLGPGVGEAVRAAARAGARVKFRTGGLRAEAFPDEATLVEALVHAVHARVPFKLTAGLHHAVRHTDAATGFAHHGFLNVIAATAAACEGVSTVTRLLARRDTAGVAARCTADRVRSARSWFASFGTCSIDEPVADVRALPPLRMEGD